MALKSSHSGQRLLRDLIVGATVWLDRTTMWLIVMFCTFVHRKLANAAQLAYYQLFTLQSTHDLLKWATFRV